MVQNSRQETDIRWATVAKNRKFNASASANTDVFSTDVTPTESPSALRVTVSEDTGVTFKTAITLSGTTVTVEFNEGSTLTADALYVFDLPVRSDATYNFQFGGNTTINVLQVDEVSTETV